MNVHKNAKLTPLGREQIVKRKAAGETSGAIATALGHGLISSQPNPL